MKRGEIYYVFRDHVTPAVGSEQYAGRPAVIVSNDEQNEKEQTVVVVYLTTQPKADSRTHVIIRSTTRNSIAICEKITTVAKERIGDRYGQVSETEMMMIEAAMQITLGLRQSVEKCDVTLDAETIIQWLTEKLMCDHEPEQTEEKGGENTFPKKLLSVMQMKQISQKDIARTLRLATGTVSNWLSGKASPREVTKIAICSAFDLPAGYFDE